MAVLTHNQASQRADELRKKPDEWVENHYAKDAPVVEDAVHDKAYQELVELEKQFPDLVTSNSITQQVGGEIKNDLSKVEYPAPILSMGDVFSKDELRELDERTTRLVDHPVAYNAELKIDGLSLLLEYTAGKLAHASTRRDGRVGEDVTANAKLIKDIPQALPELSTAKACGGCRMEEGAFAKLNVERDEEGEQVPTNPRNAAADSLR